MKKLKGLRKDILETIIKDHDKTIEFSFPIVLGISDLQSRITFSKMDLFTRTILEKILELENYKVLYFKERMRSYHNWLSDAFCNIYKFNITRITTADIKDNVIDLDTVATHIINRIVKGDKPQCLYIEKGENGEDINVILRVTLDTGGLLHISQWPSTKKDADRGGEKFDKRKVLAISGTISGSIKKKKNKG